MQKILAVVLSAILVIVTIPNNKVLAYRKKKEIKISPLHFNMKEIFYNPPQLDPIKVAVKPPEIKKTINVSSTPKSPEIMPSTQETSLSIKEIAKSMVLKVWDYEQWLDFDRIITMESGWNPNAVERHTGACGLGQANPCSKMLDKSIEGQIAWVIQYIQQRYGTPSNAISFHLQNGWY